MYVLHAKSGRYCPRELRQLDYISQFTTDLNHIKDESNYVTDALPRLQLNVVTLPLLDLLPMVLA